MAHTSTFQWNLHCIVLLMLACFIVGCPSSPSNTATDGETATSSPSTAAGSTAEKPSPVADVKPTGKPPGPIRLTLYKESTNWYDTTSEHAIDGMFATEQQALSFTFEDTIASSYHEALRTAVCSGLKTPFHCAEKSTDTIRSTTLNFALEEGSKKTKITVAGRLYLKAEGVRDLSPSQPGPQGPEVSAVLEGWSLAPGIDRSLWLQALVAEAIKTWHGIYQSRLKQRATPLPKEVLWSKRSSDTSILWNRELNPRRIKRHVFADRMWQLRQFANAWVVDVTDPKGETATYAFQDAEEGNPKINWISRDPWRKRLLIATGGHKFMPLRKPDETFRAWPQPPKLCTDRPANEPCPGLTIVAIDTNGAGKVLAQSNTHYFKSRPLIDKNGTLYIVAQDVEGTYALLSKAENEEGFQTRAIPQPVKLQLDQPRTYYGLHWFENGRLGLQNGRVLWTIDIANPKAEAVPFYTWNGSESSLLTDNKGTVVLFDVDPKKGRARDIRSISKGGHQRWSIHQKRNSPPLFQRVGNTIGVQGDGLFSWNSGKRLTTFTQSITGPFAALPKGATIACSDEGLTYFDAQHKSVKTLALPWSCADVGLAEDGTILVATLPSGAYGVMPPEHWGAPKKP